MEAASAGQCVPRFAVSYLDADGLDKREHLTCAGGAPVTTPGACGCTPVTDPSARASASARFSKTSEGPPVLIPPSKSALITESGAFADVILSLDNSNFPQSRGAQPSNDTTLIASRTCRVVLRSQREPALVGQFQREVAIRVGLGNSLGRGRDSNRNRAENETLRVVRCI